MTAELKVRVHHQVTEAHPRPLTFQLNVETALYLPIDIEAEVELAPLFPRDATPWLGTQSRQDAVLSQARNNLARLFALTLPDGNLNPAVDFGYYRRGLGGRPGEVAWSEVVSALCATPGVRKVSSLTLNGSQQDVPLGLAQFPTLGRVTLHIAGGEA